MALLIDPPSWPAHGRRWSHLVSDRSVEELHSFAVAVGLPVRLFEGDHYDVPVERYQQALAAGARPVSGRELVERLTAAGLRRPKRKGEVVHASRPHAAGARWDVVASSLPLDPPASGHHLVAASEGAVLLGENGIPFLAEPWERPAEAQRTGYLRLVGPDSRRPRVVEHVQRVPASALTAVPGLRLVPAADAWALLDPFACAVLTVGLRVGPWRPGEPPPWPLEADRGPLR